MKNNMKVLAALIVTSVPLLSAQAQVQLPAPSGTGAAVPISTPMSVGQGNTYEKEVTPLLRDISKKKSLLELRKLDRELEKLEEEALTAQIERDKALNPAAINVNPNSPNFGQTFPTAAANPQTIPSAATSSPSSDADNIRVLMVYGFDTDLYAKISNGTQGGYIVRKGDVLPDGRLVTNITSNFIEVKKQKSKSKGVDKLYVSGPLPAKTAGVTAPATPGGTTLPIPTVPTTSAPANTAIPPGSVIIPNSSPLTVPASGAAMMRR